VGALNIPLIWIKDGVILYGTESDGIYTFSRFVEEVLPAYDALDAALDATNEALGPTGFQLELWGNPHT